MKHSTILFAPLALAVSVPSAFADGNSLGIDVGLYSGGISSAVGNRNATIVSPVLEGRFNLSDKLQLDLAVPFVAADGANIVGAESTRLRLANPYLGVSYGLDLGPVSAGVGVGVGLPAARLGDGLEFGKGQADYGAASLSRGNYRYWLWAPEALSLVVPLEAEIELLLMTIRGDAAWALLVSTGSGSEAETMVQLGGEALFNLAFLGVGARAQAVYLPTVDGDNAQFSVGPVVELNAGPVFARGMLVFNVDGPGGTSFSDGSFWGVDIGAGIRF